MYLLFRVFLNYLVVCEKPMDILLNLAMLLFNQSHDKVPQFLWGRDSDFAGFFVFAITNAMLSQVYHLFEDDPCGYITLCDTCRVEPILTNGSGICLPEILHSKYLNSLPFYSSGRDDL